MKKTIIIILSILLCVGIFARFYSSSKIKDDDVHQHTYSSDGFCSCGDYALSLSAHGDLTIKTKNQSVNVDLYDNTQNSITLAQNLSDETFGLYDSIIDYRIDNSITSNVNYLVKVHCDDFSIELTTPIFSSIFDIAELRSAVDRETKETDNIYYYLTADITATAEGAGYGTGYQIFCSAQNVENKDDWTEPCYAYLNLNGRGHSINVAYSNPSGGDRWLFDYILESNIKNLSVNYDVKLSAISQATFANRIYNSVFENCYFSIKTECVGSVLIPTRYFAHKLQGVSFDNCVFNIIDNRTSEEAPFRFSSGGTDNAFSNCAVSYNNMTTLKDMFKVYPDKVENVTLYSTITDLIQSESAKPWNNEWKFYPETQVIELCKCFAYGSLSA